MAKKPDTFGLGIAVIVIVVLFFGSLLFIGGSRWFGPRTVEFAVRFPVSAPLPDEVKPGAPVFCGLRKVGDVQRVKHEAARDAGGPRGERLFVYLDFRIHKSIVLLSDCRIVARGPLLGGGGKLVIADPGSRGTPLRPGAVIDGTPGSTFDSALETLGEELDADNAAGLMALIKGELDAHNARSLLAKIHRSLDDVNAVTAAMGRELDPREKDVLLAKLHQVLDNVNAATASLRDQLTPGADGVVLAKVHEGLDTLNTGLADVVDMIECNRPAVDQTLAGVERTVDTLDRRITTPIGDELDARREGSLLAQVHEAFGQLNQSLDDLTVVSDKTRKVVILNEDRFHKILANVSETSAHLKSTAKDIRRNPWRLLYRPTLEETRQLNIFDAAREFSEAAAHLDDSAAQLRALLESRGGEILADDPDLREIRDRLQETFEKFTVAEEALWKEISAR